MAVQALKPPPMATVLLFIAMALLPFTASEVHHLKWEVGYVISSPDCVEKTMIGINGAFPGPTVRAAAGDALAVELTNALPTEGVVIHWHGVRQRGTPWADGTAAVSQCAINPGETFLYKFTLDRAGTYFYHGHYGMQRAAGLYGSLIVSAGSGEEPFSYDGEINLLLSDHYHEDIYTQMAGLSAAPFRWIGEPQSLLINGKGQFNCSPATATTALAVEPKKTYRIRISSVTSLSSLNVAIADHKMTVVEADGHYVNPFAVDDIDIYSGESYSVLISTDQDFTKNYWIAVGVRGRLPATPPALAVLSYNAALPLPAAAPPATPPWNDYARSKEFTYKLRAHRAAARPAASAHRRILLLGTQTKINGMIKWSINNVSTVLPAAPPYLRSLRRHVGGAVTAPAADRPPDGYDIMSPPANPNSTSGSNVFFLDFNSTVDIVLQNANALAANVSEIHPWHLHGHDFWVVGRGDGRFTPVKAKRFNLEDPPVRNTVVVFPYGWVALRFLADNPGVWMFHCHVEPHLEMGMAVVFAEGVGLVGGVPRRALDCH